MILRSQQQVNRRMRRPFAVRMVIAAVVVGQLIGCYHREASRATGTGAASVPPPATTVEPVTEVRLTEPIESLPPMSVTDDDWPWWRGLDRTGVSRHGAPPRQWEDGHNILWKTPLVGRGNSSPIVYQSRVYLTTSTTEPQTQCVISFDTDTGKQVWQKTVHTGGITASMNEKATYADTTLACDGERLFAVFLNNGGIHVTALTLDGEIVWTTNAGSFQTIYGYGASPVLFESFVIVAVDDPEHGFLSAFHRQTGKLCWRVRRSSGESFATPIVAYIADHWQLLMNGKKTVASYDPATGELLWSHESAAVVACNTMAFGNEHVFASGGMPDKETTCLRAAINIDGPRLVWKKNKPSSTCYVPSLLYHEQRVFNLNDDGVLSCFDAHDGRQVFMKRFSGKFTASPVISNGNLIITNEVGTSWVLQAVPPFDVVHENQIEPGVRATPTIARSRIYLRSENHLHCIAHSN